MRSQRPHRLTGFRISARESYQRHAEKLWQQHKIGTIFRQRIDKVFDLSEQVRDRGRCPHLPLNNADPHRCFRRFDQWTVACFVVQVVPLEQGRIASACIILRQVAAHDAFHLKVIGKLKIQYGIVELLTPHALDVFHWRHAIRVFRVAADPPARQNAAQVAVYAELFPGIVEAPSQAVTPVLRVDHDVDPV